MSSKKDRFWLKTLILLLALLLLAFVSMMLGSLKVGAGQLFRGLFIEPDELVAAVVDLRFPRIFISVLAGSALSVAGCQLQAVLHNPLADPGIIGVSGGAQFMNMLAGFILPQFYFAKPLFSFIGGALGFVIVYFLALKDGLKPLRIILTGIAINAMFMGMVQGLTYMSGQIMGATPGLSVVNISMKGWPDVYFLLTYIPAGLIVAMLFAKMCNLLLLEEKTIAGLGIKVSRMRFLISMIAVFLASLATSIVGIISFLALIVPHVARFLIGNDHTKLLPFAGLLGGFIFLFFDTLGRLILLPIEIPAAILMMVIGGPIFIILFRKGDRVSYGR